MEPVCGFSRGIDEKVKKRTWDRNSHAISDDVMVYKQRDLLSRSTQSSSMDGFGSRFFGGSFTTKEIAVYADDVAARRKSATD